MRSATLRSLALPLGLTLALAGAASAARAAGNEPAWDDSHMQSNFARQRGPAPPRPAVQGASRYQRAIADPAPTPPTGVSETTLQISPLEWTPGGPTAVGGSSTPPWAAKGGTRSDPRPSASSGVRTGSSGARGGSSPGQHSRR